MPTKTIDLDTSTSGKLRFDTDTLVIDETNNRVGIGTATPNVALEVHGEIRIYREGDRKIEFTDPTPDTEDWTIEHNESSLWFYNQTGADSVLVLKDNGNVGIGTAGAVAPLHVNGDTTNEVALFESTDTAVEIQLKDSTGTSKIESRGDFRFSTKDVDDAVRIEADGNVGIGTTSPQGNLGIGSTNGVGDETNPAFVIGPSAYRLGIWTDGETAIFNNKDGDDGFLFKVKTAGYALKIDGITGNIGIGTTAPATLTHLVEANTSTTQNTFNGLTISNTQNTDNNGSAITFSSSTGANSQAKIGAVYKDRTGSSEDTDLFFTVLGGGSASEAMRIKSDGSVGIGTTSPSMKLEVNGGLKIHQNNIYSITGSGGNETLDIANDGFIKIDQTSSAQDLYTITFNSGNPSAGQILLLKVDDGNTGAVTLKHSANQNGFNIGSDITLVQNGHKVIQLVHTGWAWSAIGHD